MVLLGSLNQCKLFVRSFWWYYWDLLSIALYHLTKILINFWYKHHFSFRNTKHKTFFFFFFFRNTHTHIYIYIYIWRKRDEIREYTHMLTWKLHAAVSVAKQVINPSQYHTLPMWDDSIKLSIFFYLKNTHTHIYIYIWGKGDKIKKYTHTLNISQTLKLKKHNYTFCLSER